MNLGLENNIFFKILIEILRNEAEFLRECADGLHCSSRQTELLDFGFEKPKDKQTRITDFMPSGGNKK